MSNADTPIAENSIATEVTADAPPPAVSEAPARTDVALSAPALALPAAMPAETHALLEMIGRGLAPDADDSARQLARELWAQFAQSLATVTPIPINIAGAGAAPLPGSTPMPEPSATPSMSLPTSPLATAARALKQMTPDQLIDALLQRFRAALPPGATVVPPRGIQFPLLPMTPPPVAR